MQMFARDAHGLWYTFFFVEVHKTKFHVNSFLLLWLEYFLLEALLEMLATNKVLAVSKHSL